MSATAHKVKMHLCSFTSSVIGPFEPHASSHFQVTLRSWLREVMVFLPGLSTPSPLTVLVPLEGLGWIEKGYIGGSSAAQEHKVAEEQCVAREQKMSSEGEKNQLAWINFFQPSNMPWELVREAHFCNFRCTCKHSIEIEMKRRDFSRILLKDVTKYSWFGGN